MPFSHFFFFNLTSRTWMWSDFFGVISNGWNTFEGSRISNTFWQHKVVKNNRLAWGDEGSVLNYSAHF